eukprot:Opistho-2@89751
MFASVGHFLCEFYFMNAYCEHDVFVQILMSRCLYTLPNDCPYTLRLRSHLQTLVFNNAKGNEVVKRLELLSARMDGFRRSFEYIQDYVNIYGLKIWQEEVSRIVMYNVEQECNSFLKTKVFDWQSVYQSAAIPIPKFPPVDRESVNFIGRLAREILRLTDSRTTVYIDAMSAWYDAKTTRELVNIKMFGSLHRAVGSFGLAGLDRLLCFMVVREMQAYTAAYKRLIKADKSLRQMIDECAQVLDPATETPANPAKVYPVAATKGARLWSLYLDAVMRVGQIQLVRRLIANELRASARADSKLLASCLTVMNDSLMASIHAHYKNPALPYPSDDNPLLYELSLYLESAGLGDTFSKIYVPTQQLEHLSLVNALFATSQLPRLQYTKGVGAMLSKNKSDLLDGAPFVVGMLTFVRQFHAAHQTEFLAYMGQYIRAHVVGTRDAKSMDLPAEVVNGLVFLEDYCRYGSISRKAVESCIPNYLFDHFK